MTDQEIEAIIIKELEKSESIWNDVKDDLLEKAIRNFSTLNESYTPSAIPGFPVLRNGEGKVGNFIAMVLDTRNSSSHLLQALKNKTGVSQLQRVLYENTAINTLGLILVNQNSGRVTEFLGDGFLAIFKADEPKDVHPPKKTAEEFLRLLSEIVNPLLKKRYDLPLLSVGIGLSYSKTIVTVVGFDEDLFPKAIGECVYRASKLSNGTNEILYDDYIKNFWPSFKGGKISFESKSHKNSATANGYIIKRN